MNSPAVGSFEDRDEIHSRECRENFSALCGFGVMGRAGKPPGTIGAGAPTSFSQPVPPPRARFRRSAALLLIRRPAHAPVPANERARDAAGQTLRPRTPRACRCVSTPDDGESIRIARRLPIAHSSIRRSGKAQTHHSIMARAYVAERSMKLWQIILAVVGVVFLALGSRWIRVGGASQAGTVARRRRLPHTDDGSRSACGCETGRKRRPAARAFREPPVDDVSRGRFRGPRIPRVCVGPARAWRQPRCIFLRARAGLRDGRGRIPDTQRATRSQNHHTAGPLDGCCDCHTHGRSRSACRDHRAFSCSHDHAAAHARKFAGVQRQRGSGHSETRGARLVRRSRRRAHRSRRFRAATRVRAAPLAALHSHQPAFRPPRSARFRKMGDASAVPQISPRTR